MFELAGDKFFTQLLEIFWLSPYFITGGGRQRLYYVKLCVAVYNSSDLA